MLPKDLLNLLPAIKHGWSQIIRTVIVIRKRHCFIWIDIRCQLVRVTAFPALTSQRLFLFVVQWLLQEPPSMLILYLKFTWPQYVCCATIRGHPFMTSTRRGEGSGLGGRMWTGGGGPAPCGRPHRKWKLESTDVILSSSHAKKLAYFLPEFHLWTERKWKFFCNWN